MADSLVKNLLEAGVHFGHRSANWNPKMQAYVFAKRNGIHIIDVRQTIKGLLLAKRFITRVVASGKDVLFVGTKRQAREALVHKIGEEAGQPYVTERWLGGTLTNFKTIRSRLRRLEELEELMAGEEWENYSKKMASQLSRERRKIHRNLSGIRGMDKLPGAMVVIDVHRELNALREAQKLGIPTVCLIDTDSDPDLADIPIPGNDDAIRAIDIIVDQFAEAIKEGKTARAQEEMRQKDKEAESEEQRPRRRSARAQFRAESGETEEPRGAAEGDRGGVEATTGPVSETPAEPGTPASTPAAEASRAQAEAGAPAAGGDDSRDQSPVAGDAAPPGASADAAPPAERPADQAAGAPAPAAETERDRESGHAASSTDRDA